MKFKSQKTGNKTLIVTGNTDYQRLWPVLREKEVYEDLKLLTTMAINCSNKKPEDCKYVTIESSFCDGFEVRLGEIP